MNPEFAQTSLRYIQVANAFAKRAGEELNVHRGNKQAAEARIAPLVDLMISTGAIAAHQKEAAVQTLGTQAGVMDLLKNAVDKLGAMTKAAAAVKTAGDLGRPGDPDGSHNPMSSLTSPFVGQRTGEKKASDIAFMKGLGYGV